MTSKADWTVAIIGGGIAGASAGQQLSRQGASVTVFDKGRGPGGRCATRRHASYSFDHGAQYFTARDPRFRRQVAAWATEGTVARWRPRMGELTPAGYEPTRQKKMWVGTPGMNAIGRAMLEPLNARFGSLITSIDHDEQGWSLRDHQGQGYGRYDQLLVTVPAPQAGPLLGDHFPEASDAAHHATMLPCWSLMLAFDKPIDLPFDAAKIAGQGPISWLARNSSKPGRRHGGMDCWVVQADHAWSRGHIEFSTRQALDKLLDDFARVCAICKVAFTRPVHADAHRWRYALAVPDAARDCMLNADNGLAVAGDWLAGGRVETAWLSGLAAAEALTANWFERIPALAGASPR
ncbi:MAG: FAD-dependent oxidoreductase [Planctomycetota bacterium]